MLWDPVQYGRFSDQRSRPFFDLTRRIAADHPGSVVDLGCGSGELTVTLAQRWPQASVRGIDSSAEMIAGAPESAGVRFEVGPAEEFEADGVDVLVSNALLQWVPTHRRLIVEWARQLNPGGWLAFQVPANFTAPVHVLMRELAGSPEWRERLSGVTLRIDASAPPREYLDLLAGAGLEVDAWQTEYEHILQGEDAVLEWVRGTGLRPVLQALDERDSAAFVADYRRLLRDAYPVQAYGTVLPFLRTFVVAHRQD